jgi:hypothetical protein
VAAMSTVTRMAQQEIELAAHELWQLLDKASG